MSPAPPPPRVPRLQPLARGRAAALGEPGRVWLQALPARLERLCEQWDLELGRPLPGGSASYVVRARTRAGDPRVLKVLLPDPVLADEAPVLAAADGVGYARLHAHEPGALLLESLGASLDHGRTEPDGVLDALVDTLRLAWRVDPGQVPAASSAPAPGADKASLLLGDLDRHAAACPDVALEHARVLDAARGTARDLAASYDATRTVVVHGDAHPGNALQRSAGEWAFVDPDGFRAEPAYDLGVTLRDFSRRLLDAGSDAAARSLARGWADRVAERAGAGRDRVAAWALLERVTTGMFVCSIGSEAVGLPFLRSAERLVAAGP